MENNNRIIDIIEDHESIIQTLDAICCALENNTPMPAYIPVLNNLNVTDQLSRICEALNKNKAIRAISEEDIERINRI